MDTSILLTTNALLSAAAALTMVVVLRTRRTYPGFSAWTAGVACMALGAAMLVPGALPPWATIRLVRNGLLVAGHLLILRGMLDFRGHRVSHALEACVGLAFLFIFGWYNLDAGSLPLRIAVYSVFAAALSLATMGVTLYRRPAHFGSNDVLLALWLGIYSVLCLVRAAQELGGSGTSTAFERMGFGTFYAMAQILSIQLVTLTLVSMNSQRIEWEYRSGEQRLREGEERLRSLGDNLPDGFVYRYTVSAGKPVFQHISEGVEAIFGLRASDLMADGRPLFALMDAESLARYQQEELRSARELSVYSGMLRFGLANGNVIWLEVRSRPHRQADGSIVWDGVALDVSDRKRAEEDHSRYQAIVDSSDDAILSKTPAGIITSWNRGAQRMFGYTAEEAIGRPIDLIVPPERSAEEHAILARIAQGVASEHIDTVRRHRDGTLIEISASVSPVMDAHHRVVGAATIARDVSQRNQAEREIRKLSLALDQSPSSIIITNLAADIEYVNPACEAASGYTRSELVGRNPRIFRSGLTPPEVYAAMWSSLTGGRHWRGEFQTRRKDGSLYDEHVVIAPVRQPDGTITHYLAVKEDITEKKRMTDELAAHRDHLEQLVARRTEQLADASARAEAANVAKSAFLANMSHEIRTPLNAMIGMAYLMRMGGLAPEQSERLAKLEAAASHLLDILNAILDLSKIDAGKLALEEIPLRVESVLANVQSMLADRAGARQLGLSSELDRMPEDLVGDPTRLQQALLNYASNAIKFTERGGVTLRARCLEEDAGSALIRFEVEDTGIGIAADVLPRLFGDFEQADSSTTRQTGGTGLGLAITRRLARLMGGEAGASSVPGSGSTFWFTARLRRDAAPASRAPLHAEANAEELLRLRHAGTHVLVAEDNEINAEVARAILEDAGLVVDVAVDGVEAVEQVNRHPYRLVLMDMQMPRMDGLDACRVIRKTHPSSRLPVIAMTANAFAEDKERCREAGMDDFTSKPVEPASLYALLLHWLERSSPDAD